MRSRAAGMPVAASSSTARARLRPAQVQVRDDGLGQLPAHGVQRIQRSQRILEHGADLAAAHTAHLLVGQVVDAATAQQDLAGGHAPGRLQQADDGRAGQRLAGAGFADHAQDLARLDREGHVVQRSVRAARGELHAQVADFNALMDISQIQLSTYCRDMPPRSVDGSIGMPRSRLCRSAGMPLRGSVQRFGVHHISRGLSASRSQSPSRLTDSTNSTSASPGKMTIHHSPENRKSLPMRINVQRRRRHAHAQERQRRSVMMAVASAPWPAPAPVPAHWAARGGT